MKIYNTLTRRIEEIVPREANKLKIYSCGPTVYRYIHIGNLRTFIMTDWVRRLFEYRGFEVLHVKNITDVGHMRQERLDCGEDKILAQARQEGKTSAQIAQFYTEAFHRDEAKLNILPAHVFPRATQHIPEMIAIIQRLQEKGIAYEMQGNVYYDIQHFPGYGKLSGNQLEHLLPGVHEGVNADRHTSEDFPLWKHAEPGREMAWESPWGLGFPGWHIECSAMSMKYLGQHFDVHTGGIDNIFPHHEDEIAQSEGFSGEPFVNYWIHAQHLLADGQKMAKSTGNAYTCTEIEARGFDPLALRYFYTMALYRSRLSFTFRALQAAQTSLGRLRDTAYRLLLQADEHYCFSDEPLTPDRWRTAFLAEIEHDLNIPRAMALIWSMLRSSKDDPTTKVRLLLEFDRILGFNLKAYLQSDEPRRKMNPQHYLATVPSYIATRVREREHLRQRGDYAQADHMRQELDAVGYTIKDTPSGSLVLSRRLEDEFTVLSTANDAPNCLNIPDACDFSVNLLAHNNRDDLERCIRSIIHHASNQYQIELVIVDNGSTDDTLTYLQHLARCGELISEQGQHLKVQVLFADHNMGFASGRNATMRASRGRYLMLLDTSIEVKGDIWRQLARTLADPSIGLVGPYGLVTRDLREFYEAAGPEVDAIEGYFMAFRRTILPEIGWIDERFRFYRLADIFYSFFFKAAGYHVVTVPQLAEVLEKHPHREWHRLSKEEQATKSKKNYDLLRDRWHHGESLLVINYRHQNRWLGHNHTHHLEGTHTHPPNQLPPTGTAHSHTHQHWPDHSHEHIHYHQ